MRVKFDLLMKPIMVCKVAPRPLTFMESLPFMRQLWSPPHTHTSPNLDPTSVWWTRHLINKMENKRQFTWRICSVTWMQNWFAMQNNMFVLRHKINPFLVNAPILQPWKHHKTKISLVFSGDIKMGTLVRNGLLKNNCKRK